MKQLRTKHRTLLEWRTSLGVTQREAADILGVSQPVYAQYELHNVRPRPERAKSMSQKTGIAFEVIMGVAS